MPGTGTGYAKAVPSTLHIVYSPSIQPPPPLRSSIKKTSYLFNSVFEKNLARSRGAYSGFLEAGRKPLTHACGSS